MGNRNVRTLLFVVLVVVVLYNILYFTGVVGNFGARSGVETPADDPRFNVPGFNRENRRIPAPQPSGSRAGAEAQGSGGRATVVAADVAITSEWGRNPFLTPREIWALANYRPIYVSEPAIPPGGLVLSAIVIDSTGRRVAVINGDIVTIGDTVAGMEVVDMWDDAVVFRLDGERHVVRMAAAAVGLTVGGRGVPGRY